MDIKALDMAMQELDKVRAKLKALDYNDPKYDDVEEELHDLEDDFQDTFGDDMEKVLQQIHDKYCPDSDVLLPIAYMGDGVLVESEEHPNKEVKLTLCSNPARIILSIAGKQEVIWDKA